MIAHFCLTVHAAWMQGCCSQTGQSSVHSSKMSASLLRFTLLQACIMYPQVPLTVSSSIITLLFSYLCNWSVEVGQFHKSFPVQTLTVRICVEQRLSVSRNGEQAFSHIISNSEATGSTGFQTTPLVPRSPVYL